MEKILNIHAKKESLKTLNYIKNKKINPVDVKITNVHLISLNGFFGKNVFRKDDLYVNSDTLWQIMQRKGKGRSHNPHNLSPEEILDALNNITNPLVIFKSNDRYGFVTSGVTNEGKPFLLIIEVGAGLIGDLDANINKFVTMYPVKDLRQKLKPLNKKDLIYLSNAAEVMINKKPLQ